MTIEIFFYYTENTGEIMGYSKNENPKLANYEVVKIPLEDARKFYNGDAIVSEWVIDTSNPFFRTLIRKDFQRTISKFLDDSFVELRENNIQNPDVTIRLSKTITPHSSIDIKIVEPSSIEFFPIYITKHNDPSLLYDCIQIYNDDIRIKQAIAVNVSVYVDKQTYQKYKISFSRNDNEN